MRTLSKPALVASAATASALRSTWVRSCDSQAMEGMATSSVRVCRVASKFLVTAALRALWWVNSVVMFLPYPHLGSALAPLWPQLPGGWGCFSCWCGLVGAGLVCAVRV